VHIEARERGDARQVLHEVERRALGREQSPGASGKKQNSRAGADRRAILGVNADRHVRIHEAKRRQREGHAADHAAVTRREAGPRPVTSKHRGHRFMSRSAPSSSSALCTSEMISASVSGKTGHAAGEMRRLERRDAPRGTGILDAAHSPGSTPGPAESRVTTPRSRPSLDGQFRAGGDGVGHGDLVPQVFQRLGHLRERRDLHVGA